MNRRLKEFYGVKVKFVTTVMLAFATLSAHGEDANKPFLEQSRMTGDWGGL